MFQKQSIAILLAFVASSSAFAPASFSRKAVATTFVSTVPSYSNINNALFADVEESAEPVAEVEAVEPVAEVEVEAAELVAEVEVQTEAVAEAATEEAEPVAEKPAKKKEEEDDINCVAYVVNLSYETEHSNLKEQFAQHGKVGKVFIPKNRDTGKNKGIAFVSMGSEAERDAAIAGMNESEMDGRTIYVDKAKPRGEVAKDTSDLTKVYVGNISYETTGEALEKHFSQFGEVSNVYLPTDRTSGQPRGFAFLALTPEAAAKAIEESNGILMDGRTIEVKESLPRGTKAPSRKNETKLYIGNISFDTEEGTLRELFEDYAPVVDLYVPLDQNTGRPRGFAFVTLEPENAQRAIQEVDGWEVDGRMLRVNEAQPKGGRSEGGFNTQNQGYASTNEW